MDKVSLSDLLPFIEEAFEKGAEFKIPITGTSMNPMLIQGRDYVLIIKNVKPLDIGDIPLYRRCDGSFVLHRVVGTDDEGYILCGDNQFIREHGITDEDVIGVVSKLCVNGKLFSVDDDEYVQYKNKYVQNVGTRYPSRRLKYKLYRLLKYGRK